MSDNIAAGSGLIKIAFDREEKRIQMDFSGNCEDNSCFRNDASILFFASNSYRSAFLSLGRDLNNVSSTEKISQACIKSSPAY